MHRTLENSLGDEEKSGLATRPAKLYSTTPALLRLLREIEADGGKFSNCEIAGVACGAR
jgi:hypothetical protein